MNKKIKSLEEIVEISNSLKKQNKVIVTTNGSYDILHAGHVWSLQDAKDQGDILIVGLNSDKSVKAYKSSDRPIIQEEYRAEMLAALECVDYVFIFDELNPINFVNKIKPNIHANSADYGEDCVEKDAVVTNGGKLYLLKKHDGISTSNIIDKILTVYCKKKS